MLERFKANFSCKCELFGFTGTVNSTLFKFMRVFGLEENCFLVFPNG